MAEDSTDHVQTRALEHLAGSDEKPAVRYALETRDRPGPGFKAGVFSDDVVWIQLRGGLMIATARVKIAWKGEYASIDEIKRRVSGWDVAASFWEGRPKHGYAIVADLADERWVDPYWAGPRSYGYEWIVLESDAKRSSWLDAKEPPRSGGDLLQRFRAARAAGFAGS